MFSGTIEDLGTVLSAETDSGNLLLSVVTDFPDLQFGERIAVNGICMTVAGRNQQGCSTLKGDFTKLLGSNLTTLRSGDKVNIERSYRASTGTPGHLTLAMSMGSLDWQG